MKTAHYLYILLCTCLLFLCMRWFHGWTCRVTYSAKKQFLYSNSHKFRSSYPVWGHRQKTLLWNGKTWCNLPSAMLHRKWPFMSFRNVGLFWTGEPFIEVWNLRFLFDLVCILWCRCETNPVSSTTFVFWPFLLGICKPFDEPIWTNWSSEWVCFTALCLECPWRCYLFIWQHQNETYADCRASNAGSWAQLTDW